MKPRFVLLSLLLGAFWFAPMALAQAQSAITPETIIEAWKRREKTFQSVVFKWTEQTTIPKGRVTDHLQGPVHHSARQDMGIGLNEIVPPRDTTFPVPVTLSIDGEKMRHERQGRTWSGKEKAYVPDPYLSTFDGKEGRILHELGAPYMPRPDGSIRAENEHIDLRMIHLVPVLINGRPVSQFFGPSALKRMTLVPGRSTIDGRSCVELRLSQGIYVRRLWVDPACDFVILRQMEQQQNQTTSKVDIRYRPLPGTWVPESWNLMFQPGGRLEESLVGTMDQVLVDSVIPASTFTIAFPPGTRVVDMKANKSYTVPGGSSDHDGPRADSNGRGPDQSNWKAWLSLAGGIAALIASVIIWKIRRKKAA